jgi:hypothetical protein
MPIPKTYSRPLETTKPVSDIVALQGNVNPVSLR